MTRRNELELSRDEKAVLQDAANPAIRRFATSNMDRLGVRASAFQKITRAAKAERRAIEETVLLELVKEGIPGYEGLRQHLAEVKQDRDKLKGKADELYKKLQASTAQSALAEHSRGTR